MKKSMSPMLWGRPTMRVVSKVMPSKFTTTKIATMLLLACAGFSNMGSSTVRAAENAGAVENLPAEEAGTESSSEAVKPSRSLIYKTTTNAKGEKIELALHIFEPVGHKASDKTPTLVLFFGGGWSAGTPDIFFPHCAYFASRGMVAIAPEYRVKNREQTTPYEAVTDAKSAIRFVRANAASMGIDPQRIAAGGSSAGGHVAACAGIVPGLDETSEDANVSSVPDALVLYNPVVDTSTKGYANSRLGARWQEISPQHHIRPGLPPTIIFHGTADKLVPYANAVDFDKAMKEAGNRCELVSLKGVGHGFVYRIERKAANASVRQTDVFLASLGYLQGEPTLPAATK